MSHYTLDHLCKLPYRATVGDVAAALDLDVPGWERKVDLEKLDMTSPCNCVAGQVARSWSSTYRNQTGYSKFLSRLRDSRDLKAFAGHQQLRPHWVRAIRKRLSA